MDIQFNGRTVSVRQLTVREVSDYMDHVQQQPSIADLLMDSAITSELVQMATGLTAEEINGDVLPSELKRLWEAVAHENPSCAGLLTRLAAAGKKILEQMAGSSADAPAP